MTKGVAIAGRAFQPRRRRNVFVALILEFSVAAICVRPALVHAREGGFANFHFTEDSMADYYPLRDQKTGVLIIGEGGKPLSRWKTNPLPTHTDVFWVSPNADLSLHKGDLLSVEEWATKKSCAGGLDFIWLNAYRNDFADGSPSRRYRIETTRAEIRRDAGPWIDITSGGSCGTNGQPYALERVSADPYTLRVWGNIYNADGVTVGRRFFWQHTLTYEVQASNPCWQTDSAKQRPAVRQEEAWWDSAHGWATGNGSLGANKEPDGILVKYTRWGLIAKGAGWGWQGDMNVLDSRWRFCLQSEGSW